MTPVSAWPWKPEPFIASQMDVVPRLETRSRTSGVIICLMCVVANRFEICSACCAVPKTVLDKLESLSANCAVLAGTCGKIHTGPFVNIPLQLQKYKSDVTEHGAFVHGAHQPQVSKASAAGLFFFFSGGWGGGCIIMLKPLFTFSMFVNHQRWQTHGPKLY